VKYIGLSAAVAATLIIGVFLGTNTIDGMIEDSMQHIALVEVERSASNTKINLDKQADINRLETKINQKIELTDQLQLGDLYLKTRQYNKATIILEAINVKISKQHPKHFDVQWALATAYLGAEKYDKAIGIYQYIQRKGRDEELINRAKSNLRILNIKKTIKWI